MKTTKVWSIVRLIWNCMLVMLIQLWHIISIVRMLLWKVRRFEWHFVKTSFCYLGHHQFFKKMAEEENEHANKFMEYQNKRGGTIVLLDIKVFLIVLVFFIIIFFKFRNHNNKVGNRLSRLTKRHYNWKKMFIKHCLNCMHLLPSISMIFD